MKKTRLANKATDAFIRVNGIPPDRGCPGHMLWLAGWKRGYTQGRADQKGVQGKKNDP